MERIKTPTKADDKWPGGPFGPRDGFSDSDPDLGIATTQLEARWFDSIQEEIAYCIEHGGNEALRDGYPFDQLYRSITTMIGGPYVLLAGDNMTAPGHLTSPGDFSPANLYTGNVVATGSLDVSGAGAIGAAGGGGLNVRSDLVVDNFSSLLGGAQIAANGAAYPQFDDQVARFAFGWDGATLWAYVNGVRQGIVAMPPALDFLPITGGTLISGAGGADGSLTVSNILVVPGNFSAAANGDLAVTNSVRAGGDVTGNNMAAGGTVTAAQLTSTGNINADAGTIQGASIVGTGGVAATGPGAGVSATGAVSAGTSVRAGTSVIANGGGTAISAPGGNAVIGGQTQTDTLLVHPGGDPNAATVNVTGNSTFRGNGDAGLRVQDCNLTVTGGNASIKVAGAFRAIPASSIDIDGAYHIGGTPIVAVLESAETLGADDGALFLIRKIAGRYEALPVDVSDPDAMTGRRQLFLVEG